MVDKHNKNPSKSEDKKMIFYTVLTIVFVMAVLICGVFLALGLTKGQ